MGHNPSIRGLQAVCFKCQGLVLIPGAVRSASATGLWHRAPAGVPEDPSVPLSHASCRACLWLTAPGSRGAFPAGLAPSCTLELLKPFGSIRPRSPWQTITFWLLLLGSCCVVTEPARCPGWVDALTMSPPCGPCYGTCCVPWQGWTRRQARAVRHLHETYVSSRHTNGFSLVRLANFYFLTSISAVIEWVYLIDM